MTNFTNVSINSNNYQEIIDYVFDLTKNSNILLLYGDLGSGKTFFVQQLLAKISDEDITSPTFSLVNVYNTSIGKVYHYDLYRIKHSDELINLNIEEALHSPLMIIEWPEIAQELLLKFSRKLISIKIEYNTIDSRNYKIYY